MNLKNKQVRRMKDGDTSFYQFDNEIGFWGIPNLELKISYDVNPQKPIITSHNSDGNRDIEFNPDKNKKTIVCLGGSHSWGLGVDASERYSDILRGRLDCNILNMAHPSLGLDQIANVLYTKAQKFSPNIVVIEQYPWAIHRIVTTYVNRYFRPGFKIDNNNKLSINKVPNMAKFKIFRLIMGIYYKFEKQFSEYLSGIELDKNYDPLIDPLFLVWKSHHYNYMYKLAEKIVAQMVEYCSQNNIKMLFVLGAVNQQYQLNSKSNLVDYDLPRKRLINVLNKNNVDYLDMLPFMLAENSVKDPVAFSDGHINEKGHSIFAKKIQEYFHKKGWFNE